MKKLFIYLFSDYYIFIYLFIFITPHERKTLGSISSASPLIDLGGSPEVQ